MAAMAAKNSSPADQDEDRTAQLPTPLLAHILSLLPLRAALLCGTLSNSFLAARRELLAVAAVLDFGSDFAGSLPLESYSSAVDGMISLHEAQTLDCLKIHLPEGELSKIESCLEAWLRFAASKGVGLLQLECNPVHHDRIYVELFDHTRLTHLSLSRCALSPLSGKELKEFQMPSLQALSLREVRICDEELANLLGGCPRLLVMKLTKCYWLLDVMIVSPKNLSCLTIIDCRLRSIRIYVWKLQSFHFFGDDGCGIFMYQKGVMNLRDVYLSTIKRCLYSTFPTLFYFSALAQITTLTLNEFFLEHLYRDMGVQMQPTDSLQPTFCNLKSLHLIFDEYCPFKLLCDVLQSCLFPSLENLFIEFVKVPNNKFNAEDILLLFNKLRFMSIKGFQWVVNQMTFVELFLERAVSLETLLLVMAEPLAQDKLAALRTKLNVISKASPDAQIVLCGADDVPANLPRSPHAEFHTEVVGYYY